MKIIQIAISPETESIYGRIFALADDGTIWAKRFNFEEWEQISEPGLKPVEKKD